MVLTIITDQFRVNMTVNRSMFRHNRIFLIQFKNLNPFYFFQLFDAKTNARVKKKKKV